MIALFAARPMMQDSMKIIGGPLRIKAPPTMEDMNATIDPELRRKRRRIKGIELTFCQ